MDKKLKELWNQLRSMNIIDEIENGIVDIWKNEIGLEYKQGLILKESVLHSSFYFHLRKKIDIVNKDKNNDIFVSLPTLR